MTSAVSDAPHQEPATHEATLAQAPTPVERATPRQEGPFGRWLNNPLVEYASLAVLALFSTGLTMTILWRSVDLYFPADAGEYVADADALWGRGVREIRHPLLFPALLSVFQPFVGDVGAFNLGIAVALFLLPVSLYLLLRQYLPPIPGLVGAALGSMSPPVGELLGWGGASTLLAIDLMLLSVASLERWTRRSEKWGLAVGLFVGLTSLSHPFVFTATAFVVLVRWGFHAVRHRSFGGGWGPMGWRGIGSAVVVGLALFSLSAGYYLVLKTPGQSGLFDVGFLGTILLWAVRENVYLLFFLLLGVLLPLPRGQPELFVVMGSLGLLIVMIPLMVSWDLSYSSRVVYFLPIVFGAGAGLLADLVLDETRRSPRLRRVEVPVVVAILLAAAVAAPYGFGYAERVQVASAFYQRVHADDLSAFDVLRTGTGTVAVSWPGALQGEGVVDSWFVEGLSKRPALGPGAPWLSTLTTLGPAEMDLQRFFAGTIGVENGAVQIAGARTGSLADPAVSVNVSGFYYPLVYLNSYANGYPVAVQEDLNASLVGDALVLRHPALVGGAEVVQESRLDASGANITYTLVGGNASAAGWDIWLWPAYYRPWEDVAPDGTGFRTVTAYRDTAVATHVFTLTPGAAARYYSSDPRWGLQAIELTGNGTTSFSIRIRVETNEPAGQVLVFDESTLLARYGITDVLLWKDTGWQRRFENSPRFERVFETPNLLVYRVLY